MHRPCRGRIIKPHDDLNYAPPTGAMEKTMNLKRRGKPLRYNMRPLQGQSLRMVSLRGKRCGCMCPQHWGERCECMCPLHGRTLRMLRPFAPCRDTPANPLRLNMLRTAKNNSLNLENLSYYFQNLSYYFVRYLSYGHPTDGVRQRQRWPEAGRQTKNGDGSPPSSP